jgi:ketosteroid isomerase-like protein
MKNTPPPLPSADDIEHQFYAAMQEGHLENLMATWADDDEITCIHPGGPRLSGPPAIRAAFESLFSNGSINAQPERVRRLTTQNSAIHSVIERIQINTPEGPQIIWLVATNVYVKTPAGWRLVVHHASPGSSREIPEINHSPHVLH